MNSALIVWGAAIVFVVGVSYFVPSGTPAHYVWVAVCAVIGWNIKSAIRHLDAWRSR